MSKGTIREYDSARGVGVIVDKDTGQQLTVYANYVNLKDGESLIAGQSVVYEVEKKRHDAWAVNVRFSAE